MLALTAVLDRAGVDAGAHLDSQLLGGGRGVVAPWSARLAGLKLARIRSPGAPHHAATVRAAGTAGGVGAPAVLLARTARTLSGRLAATHMRDRRPGSPQAGSVTDARCDATDQQPDDLPLRNRINLEQASRPPRHSPKQTKAAARPSHLYSFSVSWCDEAADSGRPIHTSSACAEPSVVRRRLRHMAAFGGEQLRRRECAMATDQTPRIGRSEEHFGALSVRAAESAARRLPSGRGWTQTISRSLWR